MRTLAAAAIALVVAAAPGQAPIEFTPMPGEIPAGHPVRVTVMWENHGPGDMLVGDLFVKVTADGRLRGVIEPERSRFVPIGFSPDGRPELEESETTCTWSFSLGRPLIRPGQSVALEVWIPTVGGGDVMVELNTSAVIASQVVEGGRKHHVRVAAVQPEPPSIEPAPVPMPDPMPAWIAIGPVPGGKLDSIANWNGTPVISTDTGLFALIGGRWQDISPRGSGRILTASDGETLFAIRCGSSEKAWRRSADGPWIELEPPPGSVGVMAAGSGWMLAGGEDGLFSWTDGRWRRELSAAVTAIDMDAQACAAEDGTVWLVTADGWRPAAGGAAAGDRVAAVAIFSDVAHAAIPSGLWRAGDSSWERLPLPQAETEITALAAVRARLYAVTGGPSGCVWSFNQTEWIRGPAAAAVTSQAGVRHALAAGDRLWRISTNNPLILTPGSHEMRRDGWTYAIDPVPFVRDGRAYAPLRAVIEALGGTVSYDEDRRTATCLVDGTVVVVDAARSLLTRDKTVTQCGVFVHNEVIVVAVRVLAEMCGADVTWDAASGTILIWP